MPRSGRPQSKEEDLSKSVQQLALRQKQTVADSWEDEDLSSDNGEDDNDNDNDDGGDNSNEKARAIASNTVASKKKVYLSAETKTPPTADSEPLFNPDGTPISPRLASGTSAPPNTPNLGGIGRSSGPASMADRASARPEKTVAPAARMIAGALGVRAPKKTEEQKAYDAAVRKQEMKRREEEKEWAKRAEREREQAKKDIWDG